MTTSDNFYEYLRGKIHTWVGSEEGRKSPWVEYVLVLPDLAYLLGALVFERDVSPGHKIKLGMAMAYLVCPIDFLPEAVLGPAGYTDDVVVVALALNNLLNEVDQEVVLRHWKGDGDLLNWIQQILLIADEMIGSGLWEKIKARFNR